ncbi:hypothetical protein [Nocardioides sp. KR10-350]|uniref:hypothetical protein n=1 Tax=Nocardioides cheoyonin TaxID=3156615 RepID=UPI0032B4C1DA
MSRRCNRPYWEILGIRRTMLRAAIERGDLPKKKDKAFIQSLEASPPAWLVRDRKATARLREKRKVRRDATEQKRRAAFERQYGREIEIADAYLRAIKDNGDTDAWAAQALRDAGITHLADGTPIRRHGADSDPA